MGMRYALILACLLYAFVNSAVEAKRIKHYHWVLENKNFTRMCTDKSMIVVNGSFPGPVLRVHKGDTVYITIHNQGSYNVTVHCEREFVTNFRHGVMQPRNPWSDGPEYVAQCPIAVGTSFTHEVIFSEEEGTLWWHAHSDWTRATVHGAIVIEPAKGTTYPFKKPDGEEIIVLADWFDGDVMTIMDEGLITGAAFTESTAFVINGLPGPLYNCTGSDNTTRVENATRIKFEHGKTYLLRIINAVMNDELFFGIANHTMTVVGMDGAYLKPFHTKYLMITPGQTMDVLVTASHKPSHYYIAAKSFSDSGAPSPDGTTTAIIEYVGNYTVPTMPYSPDLPDKTNTSAAGNFSARLLSVANKTYPVNVPQDKDLNRKFFITAAVGSNPCTTPGCVGNNNNSMRNMASLNNISIILPTISYLEAYYGNIANVFNATFPNTSDVVYDWTGAIAQNFSSSETATLANLIAYGSAVEMIFQGTNSGAPENHPMHLHGQSFYVVGMGYGNYTNESRRSFNQKDPPFINTVGVPTNGWAAIRFWAKNPGVWFMHCHLEKHVSWGMGTVFITLNGNTTETSILSPPKYMPPC